MEYTQAGKDLIEMGSLRATREDIIDFLAIKLGRMDETWREELNVLKDLAVLKALYHAILRAKTRKQVQAAFDAALRNGHETK